jgi:lysozyme family protein
MSFQTAYVHILEFEGGYANDPRDKGGETYRGISRVSFPDWPGWPFIDEIKAKIGGKDWSDYNVRRNITQKAEANPELEKLASDFYEKRLYNPLLSLDLPEIVRDKYFDMLVNMGPKNSVKILQRAVQKVAKISLVIDGKLGPATLGTARWAEPSELVKAIAREQENFYQKMAYTQNNPKALPAFVKRARWIPNV